jgi:hypothetical protein
VRIHIERRGGIAGRKAVGDRDESELSSAQRESLQNLLRSPPRQTPAPGADRFSYKVRVEDEHGVREFVVPEDAMPDSLAEIPKLAL